MTGVQTCALPILADSVIQLDNYEAKNVTVEAKKLSRGNIIQRIIDRDLKTNIVFNRVIKAGTIAQGDKGIKMKTIGLNVLSINHEDIELRAVEQIVDSEQINAIGSIMKWAELSLMSKELNFGEMVDNIICQIDRNGLISMDRLKGGSGSLAMPRKQEIMATYNRYRKLKV